MQFMGTIQCCTVCSRLTAGGAFLCVVRGSSKEKMRLLLVIIPSLLRNVTSFSEFSLTSDVFVLATIRRLARLREHIPALAQASSTRESGSWASLGSHEVSTAKLYRRVDDNNGPYIICLSLVLGLNLR